MAPADLDHFRWLYGAEPGDLAGIAERFEEELVINQSPEMPGTAGTFHGYEGLAAVNAEISESYAEVLWVPQEVVDLGQDRHLVLLWVRGRGRQSGVELEGDIGHIVTLREGRIAQIDTYLGWDKAREAAAAARGRR